MMFSLWSLVVTMVTVLAPPACHAVCYSTDPKPYRNYAAKTRYDDSIQGTPPMSDSVTEGCSPRLFYFLARHGSRFPSSKDYNRMIKLLPDLQTSIVNSFENGRGSMCTEDAVRLKAWKQRIRKNDVDDLAETGVKEMEQIAKRYQMLVPSLLNKFDKEKYLFQSSYMERNILSAKAFARGLFNSSDVEIKYNPKGQDPLLQFYKACPKTVETYKRPMPERTGFIEGHISRVTIPAVENFLGLTSGNLSFDDLDAMYKMCVFDHVVFDDSPWCAVFSRQNIQSLEYLEDLWNYYLEGPSYQINVDQSCDLVKDVVKYLRLASDKEAGSHPIGVFRFTHSPVINSFLAQLGLFEGQKPLLANNMKEQEDRKFRLAAVDPYSAHVAFIVEECEGAKFELRTYVNQRLYSGQEGTPNLNLKAVMELIGDTAGKCNFEDICASSSTNLSGLTKNAVLYLTLFLILTMI